MKFKLDKIKISANYIVYISNDGTKIYSSRDKAISYENLDKLIKFVCFENDTTIREFNLIVDNKISKSFISYFTKKIDIPVRYFVFINIIFIVDILFWVLK